MLPKTKKSAKFSSLKSKTLYNNSNYQQKCQIKISLESTSLPFFVSIETLSNDFPALPVLLDEVRGERNRVWEWGLWEEEKELSKN